MDILDQNQHIEACGLGASADVQWTKERGTVGHRINRRSYTKISGVPRIAENGRLSYTRVPRSTVVNSTNHHSAVHCGTYFFK